MACPRAFHFRLGAGARLIIDACELHYFHIDTVNALPFSERRAVDLSLLTKSGRGASVTADALCVAISM